jgi:hypothetical protein
MAAVAIPSTYTIKERFWSWDTQRQEYKKHVPSPQGPTMQLVSVPEKPSTHCFPFANTYRCILHKHLPFDRRAVVIRRLQIPTTLRQFTRAATLKFTSSWVVYIPTALRNRRHGFRIPVGVRQCSVLQV